MNVTPQQVLQTPEPITPALLPYIACLYDRAEVPLLKATLGSEVIYDRKDKDCSATRRRAANDALELARKARIFGVTSPKQYVENVLSNIDAYVASLQPERASDEKSAKSLSVAMEDEVKPAYDRYADCLAAQLTNISVTVDTIVPVFRQVMTICRSVREAAVNDAANALAKRGWDAPTRAKAAENTFVAADAQWISIGHRYRESLFGKPRRSKPHR